MCGVIGLVYERSRDDLGQIAAGLLKTLEYRGYDSTGGAFQGDDLDVRLLKGVGAPSVLVHTLGITAERGRTFCGQVRWATFGAVTDANSQPHVVRCHTFLYGAHNGNVTNCDDLKRWLTSEGHTVLSDNDGEMVVHTVEHFFARELDSVEAGDPSARRSAMRRAIVAASGRLQGSFAAVIVDPVTSTAWAIKEGSSLYFGVGADAIGGRFAIASSDLSSVLTLTHVVVPITEGECVEYVAGAYRVYAMKARTVKGAGAGEIQAAGQALERAPVRTRLRALDTALVPPFTTFMDQEISAQEQAVRDVVAMFLGGSEAARAVSEPEEREAVEAALDAVRGECDTARVGERFHAFVDQPSVRAWLADAPAGCTTPAALHSSDAALLGDLRDLARDDRDRAVVQLLDAWLEAAEVREFSDGVDRFRAICAEAVRVRGRLYAICCGSSFHAAKVAAMFFADLAGVELTPLLPGEFRGQVARTLTDDDVVIAVSQSGETKDLIDVLNDIITSGCRARRVAIVNNVNSTIALEKSDLVIPLRCGPEVAVPATKSFMVQMVVFYGLALALGSRLAGTTRGVRDLELRREHFRRLPDLIRETVEATRGAIEKAAALLYLRPSLHLLATRATAVAKEGALKIREVVLNHTEGFEASEFKHGPNTILGVNTVIGLAEAEALAAGRIDLASALRADYPLVYITGPDARDVALTVSQINTHKIRGASTVIVAEESAALRGAADKAPDGQPHYRSVYITLPPTGDTLLAMFSSIVALQRLALGMSLLKKAHLDRLGIADHGVDPDAPKNVSKSITVD
jgi:glucosamine--fructose-6-phosphate aminotransferase (isomerizing)